MKARLLALCVTLGLTATIVATAQARTPKSAVVSLRKTSLGTILVDPRGRMLYLFEKDGKGTSACTTACLRYWPALTSHTVPHAGTGVKQSLLGLTKPQHGLRQVTYAGHPLYTFVGDKRAGQTSGEGLSNFGADWYALSASGRKVEQNQSSNNSSSSSGGYGSGGGY